MNNNNDNNNDDDNNNNNNNSNSNSNNNNNNNSNNNNNNNNNTTTQNYPVYVEPFSLYALLHRPDPVPLLRVATSRWSDGNLKDGRDESAGRTTVSPFGDI